MATESERPPGVERRHTSSSMEIIIGLLAAVGIVAILFYGFFDRSPSGPITASSKPVATAPQRTAPKTTKATANTTNTPSAPSTK